MLSKPLLTTHEVADLLKVKEATIRAWIRAGDLPAVHLHREWRVAVKHLEEFVASRLSAKGGPHSGRTNNQTVKADATHSTVRTIRKARRSRGSIATTKRDLG